MTHYVKNITNSTLKEVKEIAKEKDSDNLFIKSRGREVWLCQEK